MKTNIKKKVVRLICKKSFQPIMHKLYLLSLTGMNYGNANTLEYNYTGEQWVINYLVKRLQNQRNLIIFDAGANAGSYSLQLSKAFSQTKIKIYAFEPSRITYNFLINNTAAANCIECFNLALGVKEETATLYSNFETSGANTLYNAAINKYAFNKGFSETINIKSVDNFCQRYSIETIHFLKIDVEGHEYSVLLGAMQMLKTGKIKFIQFEFGPLHIYSKIFFKDFWDLLSPLYNIYRIIRDGIFEIKTYTENFEIFRTANFLAELK